VRLRVAEKHPHSFYSVLLIIGIAREGKKTMPPKEISGISCCFVLQDAASQQNTSARLKSKYLAPP